MIVVATDAEYKLAKNRFKTEAILKTGVGALNVIQMLRNIDKEIPIINFGYAGSNTIPIGQEVKIGKCQLYHPLVEYNEPIYYLEGDTPCYTSDDFITKTSIKTPCVFDMELAYIMALGFKNVTSIKIISDNLSMEQYVESIN